MTRRDLVAAIKTAPRIMVQAFLSGDSPVYLVVARKEALLSLEVDGAHEYPRAIVLADGTVRLN